MNAEDPSLTFERDPVLPPLSPSHQLQLPILVQGHQRLEGEPACPANHALLLLQQLVQLFQGAQRIAAGVLRVRGGALLHPTPTGLQLTHEVLVDVLP